MESSKLTDEQKEILDKLSTVESSVKQGIEQEQRELVAVRYYEEFVIQTEKGPVTLNNVYITVEKDQNQKISYHFRWINEETQEIEEKVLVNENGEVYSIEELQEYLANSYIDMEQTISENDKQPEKLRAISKSAKEGEVKEELDRNKESEKQETNIEQDIEQQLGQENLEISNYREIKDSNFAIEMKNVLKGSEEVGVAYSKTLNTFIMIEKVDGRYQMVDGITPAKPTMKKVISIEASGQPVVEKVPNALMKTNDPRKEVSITIDQYGYVEAGTVNRLPCNERVEFQLREAGEGIEGRRSKELENITRHQGERAIHDLAHAYQDEKEAGNEETSLDELKTDNDEHVNDVMQYSEEEEKTIEEEAAKDKVSVEEFKEHLKNVQGDNLEEKIEIVHEQIAQEYGAPTQERK